MIVGAKELMVTLIVYGDNDSISQVTWAGELEPEVVGAYLITLELEPEIVGEYLIALELELVGDYLIAPELELLQLLPSPDFDKVMLFKVLKM